MVRVGVVIAQHFQTPGARVLFHPNLVFGVNQILVPLRFPSRLFQRQKLQGEFLLMPQVLEWHNLGDFLQSAAGLPQQNPTALVGILPHAMLANHFHVRLIESYRHQT